MTKHNEMVAIVTGATSGIGFETALALASAGMRVIALGRNDERIAGSSARILSLVPEARMEWINADFASLRQVARASRRILELADRTDVLVNNAGNQLDRRTMTGDGFEMTWQVNHLAPFLMTQLLLPRLSERAGAQVITLSSIGHTMIPDMVWDDLQGQDSFSPFAAYCQSKLANVLFTRELAGRSADFGLVASAVHPGLVASDFANKGDEQVRSYYAKAEEEGEALTAQQGADTVIWLALDDRRGNPSGGYFCERARVEPSSAALDEASAQRLWTVSEQQVAEYLRD